jgi:hypothetical protein
MRAALPDHVPPRYNLLGLMYKLKWACKWKPLARRLFKRLAVPCSEKRGPGISTYRPTARAQIRVARQVRIG